jgi:hypothetical protein
MDYTEKRQYPRLEANRLIPYYLLDKGGKILIAGLGKAKNISEVGLLMVTNEIIESEYILIVTGTEFDNVIKLKGRVVHSTKSKTGEIYTGVEFVGDDDIKLKVAEILKNFAK